MKVDPLRKVAACAALAPWVDRLWTLSPSRDQKRLMPIRVLPDGCVDLIFVSGCPLHLVQSDGTPQRLPMAFVSGPMKRASVALLGGTTSLVGARFRPGGAFPLLRIALHELADQSVPLEELLGGEGKPLADQVAGGQLLPYKLHHLGAFLLRQVSRLESVPDWLAAIIRESSHWHDELSIPAVARIANLSAQHLERQFQARVGISPKRFLRIVRLRRILPALKVKAEPDWADLAAAEGFYDQAHLIHEFRHLAGVTPRQFWRERTDVGFLQYTSPSSVLGSAKRSV